MTLLDWLGHGLWPLPFWGILLWVLLLTHITIVTVTVYLHRHVAHRSVELHPILQHGFRFWSWFTTGMVTVEWAAVHRRHHATTETEADPHSPQIHGLGAIFWRGAEAYRSAAADPETMRRYASGCPDDWLEHHLYRRYPSLGVLLLGLVDVLLFGFAGLTVWAIQMLWIPVLAAGVINGVGHFWGYRNFESRDASANILPWGILIGGEELHNNHHAFPNSAKLSQKWWEFDIGWGWIRLFQCLGLARPLSTGPIVSRIPGKTTLDMDTAWAVLNDRFRLMANYRRFVVQPLLRQERSRADQAGRRRLRRAGRLLCREQTLVCERGQQRIADAVSLSQPLATVYQLRLRLQDIWETRGGCAEEMLASLRQWCRDAEESGIQTLREFVADLKSCATPRLAQTA